MFGMLDSTTFAGAVTFSQFAAAARQNLLQTVPPAAPATQLTYTTTPDRRDERDGSEAFLESPEMPRPVQLHFVYVQHVVGGQVAAKRRPQAADSFYAMLLNRCG